MFGLPNGGKRCSKCGRWWPATLEFFRPGHRQCRSCERETSINYYRANRDERLQKMKAWKDARRPELREQRRKRYHADPETERASHRKWLKKNRERTRVYARSHNRKPEVRARRAEVQRARFHRSRGAPGVFTTADIARLRKSQHDRCYYCGKKQKLTVDHIVPLSRGGSNSPDNIVLACRSCNSSKNDRLPHEWPDGGRLL